MEAARDKIGGERGHPNYKLVALVSNIRAFLLFKRKMLTSRSMKLIYKI
jgi:hypothetical protein